MFAWSLLLLVEGNDIRVKPQPVKLLDSMGSCYTMQSAGTIFQVYRCCFIMFPEFLGCLAIPPRFTLQGPTATAYGGPHYMVNLAVIEPINPSLLGTIPPLVTKVVILHQLNDEPAHSAERTWGVDLTRLTDQVGYVHLPQQKIIDGSLQVSNCFLMQVGELEKEIEVKDATAAALAEGINSEYLAKNGATPSEIGGSEIGSDSPQVASSAHTDTQKGAWYGQTASRATKEHRGGEGIKGDVNGEQQPSECRPRQGQALRDIGNMVAWLVRQLPRPWGR